MLTIRLARHWRKKRAFYRIVLTEHTKPIQSWYKLILWWFDPYSKQSKINLDAAKSWITKWAKPSPRVAKIIHKETDDESFAVYYTKKNIDRKVKNPDKFES